MKLAARMAAKAWRGPVSVVDGLTGDKFTVRPPCGCAGLGLVARAVEVRGTVKYTFDPCPGCTDRREQIRRVTRKPSGGCLTLSDRG